MSNTVAVDPSTFLTGPSPPSCTSSTIDFAHSPITEYSGHFALLIHDLLTPNECDQLLSLAQSTTNPPSFWAPAEVNVGHGHQRMILEARNCGRIIWDDFTMAERLMARIMPHLPEQIVTLRGNATILGSGPVKKGHSWRVTRMNERLRFLKYTSGMYFREHCDGSYATPDRSEVSFLTVHIYLNGGKKVPTERTDDDEKTSNEPPDKEQDADVGPTAAMVDAQDQPLRGGATRFSSVYQVNKYLDISPEQGSCLVFQHRGLLHSGEEVESGVKYTVRSDIMYQRVDECI